jgi:hypothetical protein
MFLNTAGTYSNQASNFWGSETNPPDMNSTTFGVGTAGDTNSSGFTYVAYLFAHNAGGFGLTGSENVISCGSYVGTSAVGNAQTLGYEPQFLLIKRNTNGYDWEMVDTMRGWATNGADAQLEPNLNNAEYYASNLIDVTATGFNFSASGATTLNTNGVTYYYVAMRRGLMAVPTLGTTVYATATSLPTNPEYISNFPLDMEISTNTLYGGNRNTSSRLVQGTFLFTNSTNAESSGSQYDFAYNNGWATNAAHDPAYRSWMMRRAPSFFDEVCYSGNDVFNRAIPHNLAAVPELVLVKNRVYSPSNWAVYSATTGVGFPMVLNTTAAAAANPYVWGTTAPTSTNFYVGDDTRTNGLGSGFTYIMYLFATCPGVSKVGSYTGTGATQTIACGFAAGARFVLIKRTDSTGDWYLWDSVRGMVVGTDPSILLNTTAAEVNANSVYTITTGFQIVSTAAGINASGGTYIFLAIA